MARFDVYKDKRDKAILLLNVQADFLEILPTRLVIPLLVKDSENSTLDKLNIEVVVDDIHYVLATQYMAAVPVSQLGAHVDSMQNRSHEIIAAIDFLLQGY